jgi:hypothetical protein
MKQGWPKWIQFVTLSNAHYYYRQIPDEQKTLMEDCLVLSRSHFVLTLGSEGEEPGWNISWFYSVSAHKLWDSTRSLSLPSSSLPRHHSKSLPTSCYISNRAGPRILIMIRNKLRGFLRWELVSPPPNPQDGGPPHVGRPRLLIQYIRSHLPYLEAVSSIRNLRTCHAVVTGGTHGRGQKRVEGFGGKARGKKSTWKTKA